MKNNKPYQYNCVDKSVLLPYFKKHWVEYFYKLVPGWLTANWITLISSLAMWLMLALSFHPGWLSSAALGFSCTFLIHFYVVGDHLDGMQAKNTRTSSPLGEFLDHYFDVYNSAISIVACFGLLGVYESFPATYFLLLWGSYIAFGATMMEEKERGELYFGPVGSLEGVFMLMGIYLTCAFPGGMAFLFEPLWHGYANYWVIILFTMAGFIFTAVDIFLRLGYSPRQFNLFMVASLILSVSLMNLDGVFVTGWFMLAFYSSDYIGRLMDSYLSGTPHPYPDFLGTLLVLVIAVQTFFGLLDKNGQEYLLYGALGYFALKSVISFAQVFSHHKEHWSWVNPRV